MSPASSGRQSYWHQHGGPGPAGVRGRRQVWQKLRHRRECGGPYARRGRHERPQTRLPVANRAVAEGSDAPLIRRRRCRMSYAQRPSPFPLGVPGRIPLPAHNSNSEKERICREALHIPSNSWRRHTGPAPCRVLSHQPQPRACEISPG